MKSLIKVIVAISALVGVDVWGDTKLETCEYQLHMGVLQENAAVKAYDNGDLIETQKHLKVALFNYMGAFKPCMNTKLEDTATNSTARVNSILTNDGFRNTAQFQKFLKASKSQ